MVIKPDERKIFTWSATFPDVAKNFATRRMLTRDLFVVANLASCCFCSTCRFCRRKTSYTLQIRIYRRQPSLFLMSRQSVAGRRLTG